MKFFKPITILFVISLLVSFSILFFNFTIDDSWIGFRYSQNLADGKGLVWNEGERVDGATNFLWALTTAAIIKLGLGVEIGVKVLGILLSILSIFLMYGISKTILDKKNKTSEKWAVLAAIFFGLTPALAFWAVSGLGSSLYLAILLSAMYFFVKEEKENWPYFSGIFFALLALTRPEGIAFFGICFLYRTWRVYKKEKTLKGLIKWAFLFLIIYLPFFIWKIGYYGDILPSTFYAKKLLLGGTGYVLDFLLYVIPFILLGAISIALKPDKIKTLLAIMFLIPLLVTLNIAPLSGPYYRFVIASFPFIYLLAVSGIKEICEIANKKKIIVAVAIIALLLFVLLNPLTIKKMNIYAKNHMESQDELVDLGKWLRENVPEDSLLVTEHGGAIPYYSKLKTIEMWGLLDKKMSREGIDIEYILSKEPEIFIFSDIYETEDTSRPGMKELNLLYKDEEFLKEYHLIKEWPYGTSKLYVYQKNEK